MYLNMTSTLGKIVAQKHKTCQPCLVFQFRLALAHLLKNYTQDDGAVRGPHPLTKGDKDGVHTSTG